MTVFQKTIKYSEMSFAVFLIAYIISGICYGIGSGSFLFGDDAEAISAKGISLDVGID